MKRVLLVDDDRLVLRLFGEGLARSGFQVDTAGDGLEAMRALRSNKPDLVVLDLMMPKFSGVDVLEFIRGEKDLTGLPVIVLSNSYVEELGQAVREAGVQETLLKSRCTPAALMQTIENVLGRNTSPEEPHGQLERARHFAGHSEALGQTLGGETERRTQAFREFVGKGNETCAALRGLFRAFEMAPDEAQLGLRLEALYRKVHFVNANAGLTGCHGIARMSSALEALLFILIDKPAQVSPSILRTIANALDLFEALFRQTGDPTEEPWPSPRILVVDDDRSSNRLEVLALRRAQIHADGLEDSVDALQRLQETHYDLILLDVEMPRLDGFDLCRRVRMLRKYRKTPIIYVTSHTDAETRVEGLLSGGTDVITKPIFPMELAVKVVTHLLKSKLGG